GSKFTAQCFCGTSISTTKVSDVYCDTRCNSDPSEICGGTFYLSLYHGPTVLAKTASTINYVNAGCWSDTDPINRALNISEAGAFDSSKPTPQVCTGICGSKGYPLTGVENGTSCLCDVALTDGTAARPPRSCDVTCSL
ncbi:uncharacterized protein BDZ99DRAFT_352731, partial [Mytilinidion resinicola]